MSENIKNHLKAFFCTLVIIGVGFFAFYDFGIEEVRNFVKSLGDKPVFLFYLGSIFALLVFVIEDLFRKPNFKISIGTINETPNGDWRFLHVNVINLDWPQWFFLFRRNIAKNTSATIIFKEKNVNNLIFSMIGRWSTNLEPLTIHYDSASKETRQIFYTYNEEMARRNRLADISPSNSINDLREGELVIAFKSKDENECYGFNDDSYNPSKWEHDRQFRTIDQKLGRGEFDVEIVIRSGRTFARKNFMIKNFGNSIDKMILKEK
jgi:hypothetical protein